MLKLDDRGAAHFGGGDFPAQVRRVGHHHDVRLQPRKDRGPRNAARFEHRDRVEADAMPRQAGHVRRDGGELLRQRRDGSAPPDENAERRQLICPVGRDLVDGFGMHSRLTAAQQRRLQP